MKVKLVSVSWPGSAYVNQDASFSITIHYEHPEKQPKVRLLCGVRIKYDDGPADEIMIHDGYAWNDVGKGDWIDLTTALMDCEKHTFSGKVRFPKPGTYKFKIYSIRYEY